MTRTEPWHRDEYATVDGRPLIYTREGDEMLIRFPGGGAATPRELAAAGVAFQYPTIARGWKQ